MTQQAKKPVQAKTGRGRTFRYLFASLVILLATLLTPLLFVAPAEASYQCGSGDNAVETSINIGCRGETCETSNVSGCSALLDATFAIIRFLSAGVGIVVVASLIWAGVQYITARDDPNAVGKAKSRIISSLLALLIFIFAYAILNFVIPAGFFQ